MSYGVTPEGFRKRNYESLYKQLTDGMKSKWPTFKADDTNVLDEVNKQMAEVGEECWNVLEDLFNNLYVLTGSGKALELNVQDVTGPRKGATYAVGIQKFTGNNGTIIPQGFRVARPDGVEYITTASYRIGDSGVGIVLGTVIATTPGTAGNTASNTVTQIVNPIAGLISTNNDDPISGGEEIENDVELKERYFETLRNTAGSNIPAISARVRQTTATAYRVQENKGDTPDAQGLPPHSIKVTVTGGTDEEIAQAIFETKAAGITDFGDIDVPVEDVDGTPYTISFSRAPGTDVYVTIDVTATSSFLPEYVTQITQNIINYINPLAIEANVDYNTLIAKAFNGVKGYTDFDLYLDRITPPTGQVDLVAGADEKFVITENEIVINVTQ